MRKAFTLIELLVVVTIIIALLAMLGPSLGRALDTAHIAVCNSNQHQIAIGWAAYTQDNLGALVGSHTSAGLPHAWVASPASASAESEDHLKDGKLFPYLQNVKVYRCPSEPRLYLRSYAMSMYIGGVPGWHITQANVLSQIDSPARRILTLDENDPRGHNLGAWAIYPDDHATHSEYWIDWPAAFHFGNANVMSFADGHVQVYEFRDPATAQIAWFSQPAFNNIDLDYYQSIYAP